MTIEEMFRRIVRAHLGIILVCVLAAGRGGSDTGRAAGRIQPSPRSASR